MSHVIDNINPAMDDEEALRLVRDTKFRTTGNVYDILRAAAFFTHCSHVLREELERRFGSNAANSASTNASNKRKP